MPVVADHSAHRVATPRPLAVSRVPLAAAALSLTAAWVHLAYYESHWREWWGYGLFFVLTGVAQGLFAVAIVRWPRPDVALAGAIGNLAIVGMYVASRTTGVPVGTHAGVAERAGLVDLGTTAAEIVLAVLLLLMLPRAGRRMVVNALLVAGVLLWVLRMTGHLP